MSIKLTDTLEQQIKQLIDGGTAASTKRAYEGDVRRFWQWAKRHHKQDKYYPIDMNLIMSFILEHLEDNGTKQLKVVTIKRYLTSLSVEQQRRGFESVLTQTQIKLVLRHARRALPDQQPQQKLAATKNILYALVDTCDDSLRGVRDKAIMLVGFAAGGRRRSELAALTMENLQKIPEGYLIIIAKSKTDQEADGLTLPVTGDAAQALSAWLMKSGIREGCVFRGIRNNEELNDAISGRTICRIIQKAAVKVGFKKTDFGAHSLRAGFLTEAVTQNVPLVEAMVISGHKSLDIAQQYYRQENIKNNRATELLKKQLINENKSRP